MAMRALARRFDRDVHCHSAILTRDVLRGVSLQRVVGALPRDRQRAVMWWLTRGGPFWWRDRRHGGDDYLESQGDLVTESAIAEVAFRTLLDLECSLMSFSPSDWNQSPIEVIWRREAEGSDDESVPVENFWTAGDLEARLARAMAPIRSWAQLQQVSQRGFPGLTFGEDCFSPLGALPFRRSAATRILELLRILDRFAAAFHAMAAGAVRVTGSNETTSRATTPCFRTRPLPRSGNSGRGLDSLIQIDPMRRCHVPGTGRFGR